jgi:hypothetical protein
MISERIDWKRMNLQGTAVTLRTLLHVTCLFRLSK